MVVAGASLGACGSSDTETTTVVTVIQQAPAQTPSSAATTDAPSTSSDVSGGSGSAGSVSDQGTGGGSSGGKIAVPNEVGKQHQAAQDDLQAHGLFNLAEEDATGQGRMLIIDRNWQVVSQSPAAGTKVADDATITLKSKKYTDP
jgi:beta-lactam-binding protein with PASTA domain